MVRWSETRRTISSEASIIFNKLSRWKTSYRFYKLYWKTSFAIIWPIILILVFIRGTDVKMRCLYVILVIYGYWISDCIPEGAASLIAVFALPILKVQNVSVTSRLYLQYGFYCMIALFLAIILESSGLPEKAVLWLSLKLGGTPRALLTSINFVSLIISMRFVNAYAINIMVPIVTKILISFDVDELKLSLMRFSSVKLRRNTEERPLNLSVAYYCGVLYCTSFGGINFISGTVTNLAFRGVYQSRFPMCVVHQTPWYCYAVVTSVISFLASTLWLHVVFLGYRPNKVANAEYKLLKNAFLDQELLKNLYGGLGSLEYRQICILMSFVIYWGIWYLDEILYFCGMHELSMMLFIGDSMPFLLITFALMIAPATKNVFYSFSKNPNKRPHIRDASLLPWFLLETRVPWGRVITVGAGISLGYAETTSGLAKLIAEQLLFLKDCNFWFLLGLMTFVGQLVTEICSNTVTCAIYAPILIEFSVLINLHPVYLSVPFVCACSMAFLTPVASPNVRKLVAQVDIPLKYLIFAGLFPKFITWLSLVVTFEPYGKYFLDENTAPYNFNATNVTCFCEPCFFNFELDKYNW